MPLAILALYLIASIVAFGAYAIDKSAAKNNRRRIRENTLHLLALIGGWPGSLAAQRLLRHKNNKPSFLIRFWIVVIINCSALGWLISASSAELLRSFFGER